MCPSLRSSGSRPSAVHSNSGKRHQHGRVPPIELLKQDRGWLLCRRVSKATYAYSMHSSFQTWITRMITLVLRLTEGKDAHPSLTHDKCSSRASEASIAQVVGGCVTSQRSCCFPYRRRHLNVRWTIAMHLCAGWLLRTAPTGFRRCVTGLKQPSPAGSPSRAWNLLLQVCLEVVNG